MKTCSTCGHEYLDSYESCPFCARRLLRERALPEQPPTPRSSRGPLGPVVFGAAVLVLVIGSWQLFGAYVGGRAVIAADRARCFAKQVEVERAAMVQLATRDQRVSSLAELVPAQFPTVPKCPSVGTFTLSWSAQDTPKVTCSSHGWRGDEER